MTEERKQELRQLLIEARQGLQIRFEYGPLPIPIDIYRRYVKERGASYGVDFLSFAFSTRFTLFIVGENGELKPYYQIDKNSKFINFIKEELAPFIRKGNIPAISTGSYIVESGFDDGSRMFCPQGGIRQLDHILDRLLHIALVRGIEEAISAFERSCRPEGVHGFFQFVALVEGIRIETEIPILDGVRLVPLPSLQESYHIAKEILRYLPGFPYRASFDPAMSFYSKTLLVIDLPGFSIYHQPPAQLFEQGTKVSDLPFQVEEYHVKCRNRKEKNAFIKSFFQALSLVCNSTFGIYPIGWFLGEDKSLHVQSEMTGNLYPFQKRDLFADCILAEQTEIDKAKCLYDTLTNLNIGTLEKLQIPINRWIKSRANKSNVDKMIDLGIALESLYLSGTESKNEIRFRFSLHAAWHLGKDKAHREELMKEFKAIYDWRSTVVHTGKLPEKGSGKKKKPYPPEEVEGFITNAQNRCRDSILKILEDGEFPDWNWNNLILGEESS